MSFFCHKNMHLQKCLTFGVHIKMWDVYHKIFVIYTVYLTGMGSQNLLVFAYSIIENQNATAPFEYKNAYHFYCSLLMYLLICEVSKKPHLCAISVRESSP